MSVIDRVRASAVQRLKSRGQTILSTLESAAAGRLMSAAGAALGQVDAAQSAIIGKAFGAINSNAVLSKVVGTAFGRVDQQLGAAARASVQRAAGQLSRQAQGRIAAPPPGPLSDGALRPAPAAPKAPPPTNWTPAPMWGGLTADEFHRLFSESAMTAHAWKNLFYVAIEELTPSKESPDGLGKLNLLALDVSFAPCTMPGDSIAIGSSNMDNLASCERVEVRISTLDDDRGTIMRWFVAKCDQAARIDGTFGLPADYLVVVTITHMAPTNAGSNKERMRHRFLMRPSNIEVELSRRDQAHEERQMSFVQFDSFVEPPR